MGHCYSLDLRVRVADFVEAGRSCRAAAQHFDVSESFAIKLVRRTRDTGSPAPARQGRPPGRGKLVPYESFLIQTVEARPAVTMPELAARLLEQHGGAAAPAMLSRFLCRRGFSYKKALMAAECARADVRDERQVWHAQRQPRMREQPHRLIFLDETYVNTKMTRLRGRSRRGQRLRLSAPWIIDGPITRSAFDIYIETQLAPTLRSGDVVILDNLAVHKSEKAAQCLKQRGAVPVPAPV